VDTHAWRHAVTALGGAAVVLALVGGVLHVASLVAAEAPAAGDGETPRSYWLMALVAGAAYGSSAVLLGRRRVAPRLALTVALVGVLFATSLVAGEVTVRLLRAGVRGPGLEALVWLGSWLWAPGYVLLVAVLPLLLPDGRLPSPRWRAALALSVTAVVLAAAWWALLPYAAQDLPVGPPDVRNPVGVDAVAHPLVGSLVAATCLGATVVAAVGLVRRWRRSAGAERRRLGWVVLGGLTTLALLGTGQLLEDAAAQTVVAVAMLPLPAACTVAAVRHGLWGVEVALSRSMAYAVLAAAVVVGYVASVAALGGLLGVTTGAPLVATVVVALGVLPLHARLQRVANRLVHGDPEDPWTSLARLGDRLEDTAAPGVVADRILPELVQRVVRVLRVRAAAVELADGGRVVAGDEDGPSTRVPLHYAGAAVGALVVSSDGPLRAADRRVLDRLARQVAVAVHAVLLSREAQRARELVVAAREEERRRLRRDLHDGLGPSLAACALQAESAREVLHLDPAAAAALLDRLVPRLTSTVDDVRGLVHGLRPPALDELGLAGAVHELAARFAAPGSDVEVVATGPLGPGELPAAVDVAAYRIVAEALTNVARHAGATRTSVALVRHGDRLTIDVEDDGSGLPEVRRGGVGLASMDERAAELGGRLVVGPRPGGGTGVHASLPTVSRLVSP
jgi:signal transduction histidine kinase